MLNAEVRSGLELTKEEFCDFCKGGIMGTLVQQPHGEICICFDCCMTAAQLFIDLIEKECSGFASSSIVGMKEALKSIGKGGE